MFVYGMTKICDASGKFFSSHDLMFATLKRRGVDLLLLLLCILSFAALEARADTFDDYFAPKQGAPRCYGRTYDRVHLKSHPAQQITRIVLQVHAHREGGAPADNSGFEVGLSVWRRGLQDWYGGYAYCKALNESFSCNLEGDSGELQLTPMPGRRLKVQTQRLVFEGLTDFFMIENGEFSIESEKGTVRGKSDDASFLLTALPAKVCGALDR